MRMFLIAAVAATALFAATAPVNHAQAMTPAAPSQLGVANAGVSFEKTAWGCGWHGCVPGWHRYYRGYPYPYPYPYRYFVVPRVPIWIGPGPWLRPWYGPRWGWRYRHWRHW
jgi:hypothetical protein